jgi:hypothetical protein
MPPIGTNATMPSMQDHELYRRILGIEAPWFVDSVDLNWRLARSMFTSGTTR